MQKTSNVTIFRGHYHSFWHDNPLEEAMRDRYDRRIKRFFEIDAHTEPVLFVRAVAETSELVKGPELLEELKLRFGKKAALLLIVDFQRTAQGAAVVDGIKDLMIHYCDVHGGGGDPAPYTKPVLVALDWCVGRPVDAMKFIDIETIIGCADETTWGMYGLEDIPAFERDPYTGEKRMEDHRTPTTAAPGTPVQDCEESAVEFPVLLEKEAVAVAEAVVVAAAATEATAPPVAVESDLMEMMGAMRAKAADGITLISLGCFCGPKLTFQKIGRGAETLPFDWVRVSFDGLLHFIQTDFEGFFEYVTQKQVPNSHMVMYRSQWHSFWHDNPDAPEMREKYERRIKRLSHLHSSDQPLLFVRAISSTSELARAGELLAVIRETFGENACVLLIADFQATDIGPIMVEDCEDLLVYFLSKDERGGVGEMAPYSKPIQLAIDWINGDAFEPGCVANFSELHALAASPSTDLADFGVYEAFEPIAHEFQQLATDDAFQATSLEPKTDNTCELAPLGATEMGAPSARDSSNGSSWIDWLVMGLPCVARKQIECSEANGDVK
jgi:hypothetical protein